MIAAVFLILLGSYLAVGILFALPFIWFGVGKIDPHARGGSRGFRLVILPGTVALWPLLLRRWLKDDHEPREENGAHRHQGRLENPNLK
jgi:hypothetical protein